MLQSGFEPESSARKAGMIGLYTTEAFERLMNETQIVLIPGS